MRTFLVAALAASVLATTPANASVERFRGACVLRGPATLSGPFGNWREVTLVADGTCTGTLDGRVVVRTPVHIEAAATPREVADLGFAWTARGEATATFPEQGATIRIVLRHVAPPTGVDRGERGGVALVNEIPIGPLRCTPRPILASTQCTVRLLVLLQTPGVAG